MRRENMKVEISNGLEVRPLAELVQVANEYPCNICLETGNKRINVKSMMGMMSVGLLEGSEIIIEADGENEQEAVEAIRRFLMRKE